MDKRFLIEQLMTKIRASAGVALRAGVEAAREAERYQGAYGERRMALAQAARAERSFEEITALEAFHPKKLPRSAPISLGAVVEIEDEEEGRTFFLAPVGAGVELTGPGGDGFLSVVTPQSPIGRAVMGRRVGDVIDVEIRGEVREWTITYVE